MSASLDFKRTFQYSQALYSVVRFSLKLFLCNTYEKDGQRIQISASIGIALGQAETESFEKLYEKADEALYEVKREQKNGYKIYEGQSRV